MRKILSTIALLSATLCTMAQQYVPTAENLAAREEFRNAKLGVFLHWGIYSTFAQGEWYLQNHVPDRHEYAKAADAFYPHRFDARQWVRVIKAAGAKYICFTTRHHDGFSMWDTGQSDYNIVKATPFGRDVLKELAEACHDEGVRLHLYYSHIDWMRDDYPMGRTGRHCGKDSTTADWPHYFGFMNAQLTELLTRYGKVGAVWFDGWWDHDQDSVPFDWHLQEQYALIHRLQPACLIGNNHHMEPYEGEDMQIFERDLPGENSAGFVDKAAQVSRLPLETCQTMNGMWGYKVTDQNYKSADEIVRLLVNTSGKGANLLLNIGPQPNGELPALALERLEALGEWMKTYGNTIYGTKAGPVKPAEWGATTEKDGVVYVHICPAKDATVPEVIAIPMDRKPRAVTDYQTGKKLDFVYRNKQVRLVPPSSRTVADYVVAIRR